jgi:DNA-binding NtrC family response regulator
MQTQIYIVDDTPDLLKNIAEILQMEDYQVFSFSNALDALDAMEKTVVPDLVITDLWMPTMDGLVFISEMKSHALLKDIPVIIFSAKPVQEYEEQAKRLGVTTFIKKPSTPETILETILLTIPNKSL